MFQKNGRRWNLTTSPSAKVLTCAFLMQQKKTRAVVECAAVSIAGLNREEWAEFKRYSTTGTFLWS